MLLVHLDTYVLRTRSSRRHWQLLTVFFLHEVTITDSLPSLSKETSGATKHEDASLFHSMDRIRIHALQYTTATTTIIRVALFGSSTESPCCSLYRPNLFHSAIHHARYSQN